MEDSSQRPPMMNRQTPYMGVNKMGKNIKKSPLHQPTFAAPARDQPPPQVYNINKNDFRNIVQQLTGSPLREPPIRPIQNPSKPLNDRLQRIRPPPLAPTNRPQVSSHPRLSVPAPAQPSMPFRHSNNLVRPHPPFHQGQPPQNTMLPTTPTDIWTHPTESPVTAYMRYLQNSIIDSGPWLPQAQAQPHINPQVGGQNSRQPISQPNPIAQPHQPPGVYDHPNLPSPRFNFPSPRMNAIPPALPSPMMNGNPPPLLSPTSQFLLPSPSGFLNLLSPRSPYPLLSPGYHLPPPVSPNFSFSSVPHLGNLGPGPSLPLSPGYGLPFSPGFFPSPSPRWRKT